MICKPGCARFQDLCFNPMVFRQKAVLVIIKWKKTGVFSETREFYMLTNGNYISHARNYCHGHRHTAQQFLCLQSERLGTLASLSMVWSMTMGAGEAFDRQMLVNSPGCSQHTFALEKAQGGEGGSLLPQLLFDHRKFFIAMVIKRPFRLINYLPRPNASSALATPGTSPRTHVD